MGFRTGSYCTVWEVESKSPTMTKARVSISRKNRNTGMYDTDFTGFVDFVGTASARKALDLKERDRIKLGDVDVTNRYDKDTRREFVNYKIFSFDLADDSPRDVETPRRAVDDGEVSSDLPF